jgi:hypothetical protein
MNRAELRRAQKEDEKKTKTFVLTQDQINIIKEDAVNAATEKAFMLMLTLPLEVLISEEYWIKSAKKRIPKFTDEVLKLYKAYESGNITMDDMKKDLWEFAGIRVGDK